MSTPWIRHDLSPWERTSRNAAKYAVHLGDESWIEVSKARMPKSGRVCWVAFWAPAGFRGVHPHIVLPLFATRTLKAAQALVELWASTIPASAASRRPAVTP